MSDVAIDDFNVWLEIEKDLWHRPHGGRTPRWRAPTATICVRSLTPCATALPPPYHVHVLIQAATGAAPPSVAGARPAAASTDALLDPSRAHPALLERVRWFGQLGTFVLSPTNSSGGEEAGHLIFAFSRHNVSYDISLHAWASKIRLTSHHRTKMIDAPQRGPALPQVIATLKAIVGSAIQR